MKKEAPHSGAFSFADTSTLQEHSLPTRKGPTMPEKFLRLSEVQRRVPYSRSTIYLKVSLGEFPKPVNLGARAVAWLESDVNEWITRRIEAARKGVA